MTVAVDLNVKNLAVITVRQQGAIIQNRLSDGSRAGSAALSPSQADNQKAVAIGQAGQRRTQQPAALATCQQDEQRRGSSGSARHCHLSVQSILTVSCSLNACARCKGRGASKSRRRNRKQANQLRGKINQYAREKAYAMGIVTAETNAHGTSQYCSRCGAKGERFSFRGEGRSNEKWGKLFNCPVCSL